jgi:hypothetical protein
MWTPKRFRPVPDPLVRAAGYALLATCAAWVAVFVLEKHYLLYFLGWRTPTFLQLATLALPLVLAGCAVGVLGGSRRLALTAAALVTLAALLSVPLLPMNAGLVVVLLMAHRRLAPAEPWERRRPPIWSTDPAVALAGVGSMLVSQGGTVWIALTTAAPGGGTLPIGLLLIAPAVVVGYALGLLRGYPGWAVAATAQLAVLAALAARAGEGAALWPTAGWLVVDCLLLLAVASTYTRLFGEPHQLLARKE